MPLTRDALFGPPKTDPIPTNLPTWPRLWTIFARPGQPPRFGDELLAWGCQYRPDAVAAALERDTDEEWVLKCLGGLFRRRAREDPAWLFRAGLEQPAAVGLLGPFVKQVEWGEVRIPGRLTWPQWLRALATAEDVFD